MSNSIGPSLESELAFERRAYRVGHPPKPHTIPIGGKRARTRQNHTQGAAPAARPVCESNATRPEEGTIPGEAAAAVASVNPDRA